MSCPGVTVYATVMEFLNRSKLSSSKSGLTLPTPWTTFLSASTAPVPDCGYRIIDGYQVEVPDYWLVRADDFNCRTRLKVIANM